MKEIPTPYKMGKSNDKEKEGFIYKLICKTEIIFLNV